jgi:hypothetical protein
MPEGGSSISTDADGYQAVIQDTLDLLVLEPRAFQARLTWADLPNLQLLRAKEASARVGFMRLPWDQMFVTFPTQRDSTLLYTHAVLEFGDLMLRSRGEHLHQRTTAACEWASIARSLRHSRHIGGNVEREMLAGSGHGPRSLPTAHGG